MVAGVYVNGPKGGFREATKKDMRDPMQEFFARQLGFGLDGESFRKLPGRETLFSKNGDGKFHPASERDAKNGMAFRYKHDAIMPEMVPVPATEFAQNRWMFEVDLKRNGIVKATAQEAGAARSVDKPAKSAA